MFIDVYRIGLSGEIIRFDNLSRFRFTGEGEKWEKQPVSFEYDEEDDRTSLRERELVKKTHSSSLNLSLSLLLLFSPPFNPSIIPFSSFAVAPSVVDSSILIRVLFFFSPAFNLSKSNPAVARFNLRIANNCSRVSL